MASTETGLPKIGGDPYKCRTCGCLSCERVAERQADGAFAPGPLVRCVNCKSVTPAGVSARLRQTPKRTRTMGHDMRAHLTLTIDASAILISELVSAGCRTAADFAPARFALVDSGLDRDGRVAFMMTDDPEMAAHLTDGYSLADIDPEPTTQAEAEAAGERLVACLIRVAEHPLEAVRPDARGNLPKATLVEAAQRLIAIELAGLWHARAERVRKAILARGQQTAEA